MQPALFLDRDGVIIENCHNYVRSWDDVIIFDRALSALANISQHPFKIIIITNQSAVGQGIISAATAEEINTRLISTVQEAGGRIDSIFMCPHSPLDHCECRKPKPGLLHQAAQELSIDLSKSIFIGDAISDLQAAQAAGVPTRILVRTGRGAEQYEIARHTDLEPFEVFEDLLEVITSLIDRR